MAWWLTFIAGWALFFIWFAPLPPLIAFFKQRRLSLLAPPLGDNPPSVSVVVAARDEEDKIEACLRSLLALDYPKFEVIAVNDRSQDATGAILNRLAKENPRLKVLRVKTLPADWIGKNHALHCGAQQANGEFLLFTDGDVEFEPPALARAVAFMQKENRDHLSLFPRQIPGGFWENGYLGMIGWMFLYYYKPWLVRNPKRKEHLGIGAFNLLRRSVYDAIGGYLSLRLEVVDDIELGKAVKSAGYAQDVLMADDLVRVKWQQGGLRGLVRGMEKNAFAGMNYSPLFLVTSSALMAGLFFFPYAGLFLFPDGRIFGYAATVLLLHAIHGQVMVQNQRGWLISLPLPFFVAVHLWTLWRSTILALKRGGVTWRETFYPLDALKKARMRE